MGYGVINMGWALSCTGELRDGWCPQFSRGVILNSLDLDLNKKVKCKKHAKQVV